MKRRIIIGLLFLPMMLLAQGQGLQLAPRGGAGTWLGHDVEPTWGPQGGLDLGYLVRWRLMTNVQLGLRTGIGATYASNKMNADLTNQYTRVDYLGNTIQYTTSASVEEKHQQIALEIPALMAFQTGGFAMNVGPKILWVVDDRYNQKVTNAHVDAYYTDYKVHVLDEDATGKLHTPYTKTSSGTLPVLNVLVSAEIGYEWQIGNRYSRRSEQFIGVQLYADYGVWSLIRKGSDAFLSVDAIIGPNSSPKVSVDAIHSTNTPLNYFCVGARFYYAIQTVDYRGHGWHRYHH